VPNQAWIDVGRDRSERPRRTVGFAAEPFQRLAILGYVWGKELESHKTVKPGILGLVDQTHATGAENNTGDLSTTFAVGEEADLSSSVPNVANGGPVMPSLISAPLDRVLPALRRGDTERVDVVVRTRKVGHFFPGGTVDAFDVWVELKATDENGKLLFWSGKVEDDGKGPVEKSAHSYRSFSLDAHGNHINKRNAWASRALLYVRLIPPGAADTVHYRIHIPENAGHKIKFEARLNYRKFSWFNTQFSYAGTPDGKGPQSVDVGYDDRHWNFIPDPSKISGKIKSIPDPPIVTLAQSEITLPIVDGKTPRSAPKVELNPADWERWNDYGIGLLLQGDLKDGDSVEVDVRDQAESVSYDAVRNIVYDLGGCTAASLGASPAASAAHGTSITLSGAATCPGAPAYKFWVKAPGGAWTVVQQYGAASTYTWTPATAGTYGLEVDVRDQGATNTYEKVSNLTYVVS